MQPPMGVVSQPVQGAAEPHKDNLCADGKLLPQFYLIGGPKCATTSVSMELGRFGHIRAAPHLWSAKEWHFWEKFGTITESEAAKERFFGELRGCPAEHLVLGDFSISNLAAVPKPENMSLTMCSCANDSKKEMGMGDVPRLLDHSYGPLADNITLMVMLREPIARMQSSWYHAKADSFSDFWGFKDCCTESFEQAMSTIVGASHQPMHFEGKVGGEGSVWTSMYGRHLEVWLQHFKPSQFIMVPYKQYILGNKQVICDELSHRLNIEINCTGHDPFKENVHPHPPLEDDIAPGVLQALNMYLSSETRRLVDVLVRSSQDGAFLAGYDGAPGDEAAIKLWLENGW